MLAPPHDANALAEAIQSVLADQTRTRAMTIAARDTMEQAFELTSNARQLKQKFEQAMAGEVH